MIQASTVRSQALWTVAFLGACSAADPVSNPGDSGSNATDTGVRDLGLWPDAMAFGDAMVGGFADASDAGEWPDAMEPDAGFDGLCPPAAPFGIAQGSRLPPTELLDCDGNPHTLQELCDKKASWMFILAGW